MWMNASEVNMPLKLRQIRDQETAREALAELIEVIDCTGGLIRLADGGLVPAADQDWHHLAHAYQLACRATGRRMKVSEED